MKDEHGMPLPLNESPLPWSTNDSRDHQRNERRVDDRDGVYVAGVWADEDNKYIVHAANYIIPCREIVRRLVEWLLSDGSGETEYDIADDAEKLWDEMKRESNEQA